MIGALVVKGAAIVALLFSVSILLQALAEWVSLGGIFLTDGTRCSTGTVALSFLCLLACALLAVMELAR